MTRDAASEAATRAAIAKRFADRAMSMASMTRHVPPAEHRFAYQPYAPRRRSRASMEAATAAGAATEDAPSRPPRRTRSSELPLFSGLHRAAPPDSSRRPVQTAVAPLPLHECAYRLTGHAGAVNAAQWNPRYPPLLLSASMDATVRIWSVPCEHRGAGSASTTPSDNHCRRVLRQHTKGVKAADWSLDGHYIATGGFDARGIIMDVERNAIVHCFDHSSNSNSLGGGGSDELMTSARWHPRDAALVLFGSSRGRVLLRDLRAPPHAIAAVFTTKTLGRVHDLLFLPSDDNDGSGSGPTDGTRFVSSCAITARDASHQTLVVWDARATALLADRFDRDLSEFTSLRLHPSRKWFVAQSTANRATPFSARAPFKRVKRKKHHTSAHATLQHFSGHEVQGFGVQCSFSASGAVLASGDAGGRVFLYDATSRRPLRSLRAFGASNACITAEFHPRWPATLVAGAYDGQLRVYDELGAAIT